MGKRDGFYKRGRFWWCTTDPISKRPKSTGCTDLVAAKAWKAERERRFHDPAYARASQATFGEWAAKLIASKAQRLKPVSLRAYHQYFGHWVRLIPSSTLLADINPGTYDDYISLRRADGVTDYMIGKELTGMSTLLRLAKRSGCYPGDIEALRPVDFEARHVKGTRALTPDEAALLLSKLTSGLQAFVCLCIALGCRRSEAFLVERVDGDTVVIAGTKTEGANRTVPVLSHFRKLLAHAAPHVPLSKQVYWNLGRNLWEACDAAGIPRCCPNDLRRTHASWLKELGVDSDTVRRLLGHTSSGLVDTVYGRPRPEKLAELAERAISAATHPHDNLILPAPREPNRPWKADSTKGAHRLNPDAAFPVNSTKHADESTSESGEDRQNWIATDTRTLQSAGALARCGLIDPSDRLRLGFVAARVMGAGR